MRCPSCREVQLVPDQLESQLASSLCQSCGGHWVRSSHYHNWLQQQGDQTAPELSADGDAADAASDSAAGKRCCECGSFLIRWRVGRGFDFHLDRCGRCGGIWFDRDEWQSLKRRKLHNEVHFIFTEAWQAQVRDEHRRQAEQRWLVEQLGEQDAHRLREVQQWLDKHPKRHVLLAQLGIKADAAASNGRP